MGKIILLICLFSLNLQADSFEVLGGGLTWHLWNLEAQGQYSNKILPDGSLIVTPLIGFGYNHDEADNVFFSYKGFVGQNSIGNLMGGFLVGPGYQWNVASLALVMGGYWQDDDAFVAKGIEPFSLTGGKNAFVMVGGLELDFKIPINDKYYFKIDNLFTPAIITHGVSIGIKF